MLDYMIDHEEDLKPEQFQALSDYFVLLEETVMRNEARALQQETSMMQQAGGRVPMVEGEEVVQGAQAIEQQAQSVM